MQRYTLTPQNRTYQVVFASSVKMILPLTTRVYSLSNDATREMSGLSFEPEDGREKLEEDILPSQSYLE